MPKRYLRWQCHRLLNVWHHTPASPLPRRLDIIFDLKAAFIYYYGLQTTLDQDNVQQKNPPDHPYSGR